MQKKIAELVSQNGQYFLIQKGFEPEIYCFLNNSSILAECTNCQLNIEFMVRRLLFLLIMISLPIKSLKCQNFEFLNTWSDTLSSQSVLNNLNSGKQFEFVDDVGNIFKVGNFRGQVDFDPGGGVQTLHSSGEVGDVYILKLDSHGKFIWVKQISFLNGAPANVGAILQKAFFGADGHIHLHISYAAGFDLDPGPDTVLLDSLDSPQNAGYFATYDLEGNYVSAYIGLSSDFTVAANGDAFHYGIFWPFFYSDSVYLGSSLSGGVYVYTGGAYLYKRQPSGQIEWIRSSSTPLIYGRISLHNQGLVLSGSSRENGIDVVPGPIDLNLDKGDLYILKFDFNGDFVDSLTIIEGHHGDAFSDVQVAYNGDIYLSGYYRDTLYFNDPNVGYSFLPPSPNDVSYFLLRISSNLDFIWSKGLLSPNGDSDSYSFNELALGSGIKGGGNDSSIHWQVSCRDDLFLTPDLSNPLFDYAGPSQGRASHIVLNLEGELLSSFGLITNSIRPSNLYTGINHELYMNGQMRGLIDFNINEGSYFVNSPTQYINYQLKMSDICDLELVPTTVNPVLCYGTGLLDFTVLDGEGDLTFSWNHDSTITSSSAVIDTSGFYEMQVYDSLSCAQSARYFVPGMKDTSLINRSDLVITGSPDRRRRLFPATYTLAVMNMGCIPGGDTVTFSSRLMSNINSVDPSPDYFVGDSLMWLSSQVIYGDPVNYFEIPHIVPDTLLIDIRATVNQNAQENNLLDNRLNDSYHTIGSYDPNDIYVSPSGKCDEGYVKNTEYLTYRVRFQNTGNADAIDVSVRDTLDINLDLSTFQLLNNSHNPLFVELVGDHILEFHMPGIMLPDSASNEPQSKGSFTFRLKPKSDIDHYSIENRVGIYFDRNLPIITNTVSSFIVQEIPKCNQDPDPFPESVNELYPDPNKILVYPVPVEDVLHVKLPNEFTEYEIFGSDGKMILRGVFSRSIDLKNLTSGMYILRLKSEESTFVGRFIKK